MPPGTHWRTVRRMRVLNLVRDNANLAFALFCTVALQLEIWLSSYATHRLALSLLGLLATGALVFRCTYPLAGFLVTLASLLTIAEVGSDFDNQSAMVVVVLVFSLYSYGANARGRQAWAAAIVMPLVIAQFVTDDGDPPKSASAALDDALARLARQALLVQ